MDLNFIRQSLLDQDLNRARQLQKKVPASVDAERARKEADLKQACAGFEAIFLKTVLTAMRKSLPGDAVMGESNSMNIYRSMHDQYLAEHLAGGNQSFGIRDFLFNQLKNSL